MKDVISEQMTAETATEFGLLPEEFEKICDILGRKPNFTELQIYSVMWSEHCSYKNSIKWLKTLPRKGSHLLAEAGDENAGLVDIGNGLACAFKIESHNHPSAIEPYQGAATGVGGINRDIFTMGARPVAQLNSLRFGDIFSKRTKWLMKGVVKGIGDYGNSFGIPVIGGEVYFDPCFEQNCLINAMSVGIVKQGKQISAISFGSGNPVFIVGSATGKDGINGAAFASRELTEESTEDLPAVQVGDPFMEKLLLEATMELAETDSVIGMQDMGAAGIICSTSEMSEKGKHGMDIWLDKVPTRQDNMKAWELLLSESQERMLVVLKKGKEKEALKIFKKWDLHCDQIGVVTDGNMLRFFEGGHLAAEVPADTLVLGGGAPVYEREYSEPAYFSENKRFTIDDVEQPKDLSKVMNHLISHQNIASRKWVIEQYDSMVGTVNMHTNKPSDAGIVLLKGTNKALAMTTDCNARYVWADPEKGAAMAVAEAARNITCSGGIPSAITNCLNFGNPYNPNVYWQFVNTIKGMGKACEKFNTPVTGGNVSFYNQSKVSEREEAVHPSPVIGMIGIIEDKNRFMTLNFKNPGNSIYLLGLSRNDISCSEYLYSFHDVKHSPAPYFDLNEEFELQQTVRKLIQQNLINAAHDCSEGGLFVAVAEMGMAGNMGFDIRTDKSIRTDAFLFGEAQSRVIISVAVEKENEFVQFMDSQLTAYSKLGKVTSGSCVIDGEKYAQISDWTAIYDNILAEMLDK